ncbi:MAG: hypothetical protein GY852_04160 [bacterium]|nr:hypothetical protein [bacterium]
MGRERFEKLLETSLSLNYVERYCTQPRLVGTNELLRVAFDAVNNPALPIHGKVVEELGERMLEGLMNRGVMEALLAMSLLAEVDEEYVKVPAKRILKEYYAKEFKGKLNTLTPKTIVELLEIGQNLHSPSQFALIMDHIGKRAFREDFNDEEKVRIAKIAVKLLSNERQNVVFEAAFVLKELREPSSYPPILRKLMDKDSGIEPDVRRMLRAAAENIAMKVTGDIYALTSKFRKGEWNLRVFERMQKHGRMLRELEAGPEPKLRLLKQKK